MEKREQWRLLQKPTATGVTVSYKKFNSKSNFGSARLKGESAGTNHRQTRCVRILFLRGGILGPASVRSKGACGRERPICLHWRKAFERVRRVMWLAVGHQWPPWLRRRH